MKSAAVAAQALKTALLNAVDEDSRAFDAVMQAMRLPKKTDEDRAHRDRVIEDATKGAVTVPLGVLRSCQELLDPLELVAEQGNMSSISDAGVAAHALRAATSGAFLNVQINLPGITDKEFVNKTEKEASSVRRAITDRCERVANLVEDKIGGQ
jgi:glutamate formiminotransferase/formiminotetrahydrofolate cyclodeaminase